MKKRFMMISSPILYLLSLAGIVSVVYFLEQKTAWKLFYYVPGIFLIYVTTVLLSMFGMFAFSKIEATYSITMQNLLPAMVFLLAVQLDIKRTVYLLQRNFRSVVCGAMGCACGMGAKRYWLLLFVAFVVSFFSQVVAHIFREGMLVSVMIAALLGILGSLTKLRYLNGISELSRSMLYLVIALIGSQTPLYLRGALAM